MKNNKKLLQFLKLLLQIIVAALAGYGGSASGSVLSDTDSSSETVVAVAAHRSHLPADNLIEPLA